MHIRPIRTEAEHEAALPNIERLMEIDPPDGSDDLDHLDVLATLVEASEARVYPIEPPRPIDAIEIRMADKRISRRQLCAMAQIQRASSARYSPARSAEPEYDPQHWAATRPTDRGSGAAVSG